MDRVVLALYRVAFFFYKCKIPVVPKLICYFIRLLFGCQIGIGAKLGKNVSLGYGGLGIVIHGRTIIGENVRIGAGVTIGGRSKHFKVPIIGNRCVIGTGAKILGPIIVGDEAVVGANAVVINDVHSRCVVAGIPARVIKSDIDISKYNDAIDSS